MAELWPGGTSVDINNSNKGGLASAGGTNVGNFFFIGWVGDPNAPPRVRVGDPNAPGRVRVGGPNAPGRVRVGDRSGQVRLG